GYPHLQAFAGRRKTFHFTAGPGSDEKGIYYNWRLIFFTTLDLEIPGSCTWRVRYGVLYDPKAIKETAVSLQADFVYTTVWWASGYPIEWRANKTITANKNKGKWPVEAASEQRVSFAPGARQRAVDISGFIDGSMGAT